MRKGLVVTLGVVALVCVVSPGFALAPIISCVPDIIVSDVENNTQTNDLNFFIFSDALDLDDMVQDADDPSSTIRWSFLDPSGTIQINGILSNTGSLTEPGAADLRTVSRYATFENIAWNAAPPTADGATTDAMITLVASDGTGTDSADIIVTTVNDGAADFTDGTPDGVSIPLAHSYLFDSLDNWEWYTFSGLTEPTAHAVSGGSMSINTAGQSVLPPNPSVYGTWETTKDPALAAPLQAKTGCVMRVRFDMRSSVDGQGCPGFRMRANWVKVQYISSLNLWATNFSDQDFNVEQQLVYATFNGQHIDGREPGVSGHTYTLLYYPEQTDTLETTGIIYLGFDILDNDVFPGADDEGTLYVDQIDIDWFDNPDVGAGRAEPAMSFTDFSDAAGWSQGITEIVVGSANLAGLTISRTASQVAITVAPTNTLFEAVSQSGAVQLEPDRYYRVTYMITSTQQPGGPFGPTVRGAINSLSFIFGCNKDLKGGGLLSSFDLTPRPYQIWIQAPVAAAGSSTTEDMSVIFESYLLENPNPSFPGKTIQGTVTCGEIITESWAPFP
jgi:hypothetical protein